MTTVHVLDAMHMNVVGRVSAIMISRCWSVPLQHWKSRCLSLSVTLSDSLILLCTSTAAASSLASGTILVGNLSNHRI